ncbi:MAG: MFS transporter [Sphingomonadaceae bacterium]
MRAKRKRASQQAPSEAQSPHPAGTRPAGERLFSRDFLLASLVTLSTFSSFYLLLATLPVYVVQVGGTEADVGLVMGVMSVTAVLLRPFVGKAADDHGKRPFILGGTALLAIVSALYSVARAVPLLLGLRVFHGIGWAAFGTATSAVVADVSPRARRGAAMGYYGMFTNLAMAVGPALGVMLMNSFGFTVLFAASAGLAVVSVLLGTGIHEPARRSSPGPADRANQGIIERTALFPALILALTAMTYSSIVSFLPIYATKQGIENPGLFFTAYATVLLVARGFTGQLSDRYGRVAVIAPGLVLAALGLWLLAVADSLAAFLAVALLYGLAFAAIQPALMALVVDRAPPARRGAAMGTFGTAMDLGIGAGSFVWGFVAQTAGYGTMYTLAGIVALGALGLFLAGARGRATRTT